ncbi:hypothetical protein MFIFM68171_06312 [Madurella fahalii]|uniref:Uncharacterized protein n=1 Tax=Madurella fahalii TaxID=1157608 RepID=A0ABQ0GEB3_9PEZI
MESAPTQQAPSAGRRNSTSTSRASKATTPMTHIGSLPSNISTDTNGQAVYLPFTSLTGHEYGYKPASIVTAGPQCGIPKSRTVSVFSSISQSFSRGSLTSQRTNRARNVSGESSGSGIATPAQGTTRGPFLRLTRKPRERDPSEGQNSLLSATKSSSFPRLTTVLDDPRLVTTAMPAQYWTGRFASLQDRFRNELLEPETLTLLIEAHADGSLHDPRASAVKRLIRRTSLDSHDSLSLLSTIRDHTNRVTSYTSRIPQSASSGAILQTAAYMAPYYEPKAGLPPPATARTTTTTTANPPGMRPGIAIHIPNRYRYRRYDTMATTSTTTAAHNPNSKDKQERREQRDLTVARADDAVVVRRALTHLASLCVTDEARESFAAWQVLHARKERDSSLLPKGARMDDLVVFEGHGQARERLLVRIREREDGDDAWDGGNGDRGRRGRGERDGGIRGHGTALVRRLRRSLAGTGGLGPSLRSSTLSLASPSSSFSSSVGGV